jgi:predicted molibdopterin-dependent oxidoreductase YjgC
VAAALEGLAFLLVLDGGQNEVAQFADVVLPIATHAENDGTFTNHAGRVQRFHAAVTPPGEARPGWQALAELLARLGGPTHASAAAVFDALAAEGSAFRGLAYEQLGDQGLPARA